MIRLLIEEVTLGSTGVFAGGLILVMCAVAPSWHAMTPEQWVSNQQHIGPRIDSYMPLLDGISLLGALALLPLLWPSLWKIAVVTLGLGALLLVACISQFVNVPLNRQIRLWSDIDLPPYSLQLRKRWIFWHALRTVAGCIAFIVLLVAALA